jgi:hypothetical protein
MNTTPDLTDFQQRAAAVALRKLLEGTTFYVSDLQTIAGLIGREGALAGKDWEALRALHCMKYADMGETLARQARETSVRLLGITVQMADEVPPPKPAAAERPRLAFWRRAS